MLMKTTESFDLKRLIVIIGIIAIAIIAICIIIFKTGYVERTSIDDNASWINNQKEKGGGLGTGPRDGRGRVIGQDRGLGRGKGKGGGARRR